MKLVKILLVAVILVALLSLATWYFTAWNPNALSNTLYWWADRAETQGRYEQAIRLYTWAGNVNDTDPDIALGLADAYEASGNYTKTEYTLVTAIRSMPDETRLYIRLCRTYVAQDKLLDAVQLLSGVASTTAREELEALRPAAPVIGPLSGYYSDYMDVTVTGQGTLYVSTTEEYPSTAAPYTGAFPLSDGSTTVTAIAVDPETGLVSPVSAAVYTVGNVVREVTFTDPVLEAYVRELLGKAEGETFRSDELWDITALTLPEDVSTLSDLVMFTGLETLTLQGLSGVDLTPLSGLENLQTLSVTDCRVTEEGLEALGTLTGLVSLTLRSCGLTTLSPLAGLTGLTVLDAAENAIGSLEPLEGMTSLTWLDVSDNAITDLIPLSGLQLLQTLNVAGNPLEEPEALPPALTCLDVSDCGLEGLDCLESLTNLETLTASGNDLTDLEALEPCTKLKTLDVSDNDLSSVEVTASLPCLETLRASDNAITALPDYPEDSVLTTLEAAYNELSDLEGLEGLERLNYLDIDYNQVTDLSPLYSCRTLVQLTAYGCPVSVTQATRLTEAGVIVRYSPDYSAADPFADEQTEVESHSDSDVAEIVIDQDQAAEESAEEGESAPEAEAQTADEGLESAQTADSPEAPTLPAEAAETTDLAA